MERREGWGVMTSREIKDGFTDWLREDGYTEAQVEAAWADASPSEMQVYCEQHGRWEPEWTDCDGATVKVRFV